jgi:hypothetical protein
MSMAEFTGQTYGEASRQQASQRAVPTGPPPSESEGLLAPSERPEEPITAGMPMGAGPGPEALSGIAAAPGSREDLVLSLRAIASRYPNPALMVLLQEMEYE